MNAVILRVEEKSFEQSKSQAITGIIFFDFGEHQFPEVGWYDFPVITLDWWLKALKNIVLGKASNEELRFMDGPLYVIIERLDRGHCSLECFNEGAGDVSEFSGEYAIAELVSTILSAAKMVEATLSEKGWNNDYIHSLKVGIKELEKLD